jgi:adenosine kinase
MTTTIEQAIAHAKDRQYDVIGVGTALIDNLSVVGLDTVAELGLAPGTMTLIDDLTASRARKILTKAQIVSGGTVANTVAGVASFGGRAAFVGAIAKDTFGERYGRDLADAGVTPMLVELTSTDENAATGACYVMVTPDEERTMATHLGVSGLLGANDIDEDLLSTCAICYVDGYLLDFPEATQIIERLVASAERHHTALAFGLADPFVVDRHRDAIIALLPHVSLLFSNQDEICSLSGLDDPLAAARVNKHDEMIVVVTRGELGAIVVHPDGVVEIDAVLVEQVVDVTGAGDLFAAGMLYGCVRGEGVEVAAELGALASSEVILHLGARPMRSLGELARDFGTLH